MNYKARTWINVKVVFQIGKFLNNTIVPLETKLIPGDILNSLGTTALH